MKILQNRKWIKFCLRKRILLSEISKNRIRKKIRKDYEAGKIKERRCNMREYTVRVDGCCNTITTVQKDNYILEKTK